MGKITVISLLLSVCFVLPDTGYAQNSSVRQTYISQYKDIAVKHMQQYGIPASITLAQACLESGNGTGRLAREANNHFGIKCHNWTGKTITHTDDAKDECFRKYDRPEDSFKDHAEFLRYRDRYAFLFDLSPYDYKAWATGLKKAGYATNPQYADLLIKLIEDYKLYEYDRPVTSLPASPRSLEQPTVVHPEAGSPLYLASLHRTIYQRNHVSYILSLPGDSYASLAQEFRLFKREILRFNDLKKDEALEAGTLVYVAKKKKQSARELPMHIAETGESLHAISQRYAIRLSSLLKYNKLSKNESLFEGRELLLRKP